MKSYFLLICFSKKCFKRGIELPPGGMKTEKEVFYLNDFFDLLYEKENTVTQSGTEAPEYFEREKYSTMGPGIDFPMIMNYKDTENQDFASYYYFLNGHDDVGVASCAFLQARNDILRLTLATGFDTGLQFNRYRYYSANLGRFNQHDFLIITNRYVYVKNNPLNLIDPFGVYGRFAAIMLRDYWDCVSICVSGCMACYTLPTVIAEIC